jgi:hypothetical protein
MRIVFKKRIRLSLCLLCSFLILSCCSCGFFGDQKYVCNVSEVESIQIIKLDKYVEEEYNYEYTVLSEISDSTTFVNRLNHIKHSVNWGDPLLLDVQYVVIRIDYLNGDYDLLHPDAQCFNRSGINHSGFFFFDDEQFYALIDDYLTENTDKIRELFVWSGKTNRSDKQYS